MQKIRKIISFLNRNPIYYFIIFATYGWIIFKYYSIPTNSALLLPNPTMDRNLAMLKIEEGMYNRAKEFSTNKCTEFNKKNEVHFCKMGWNYYNYIRLLEDQLSEITRERMISENILAVNEVSKALALGGAIKFLNLDFSQLSISKRWKPYVEEGYGFFTTYIMFRDRFKYPLPAICQRYGNSHSCNFGVGQAAYYTGIKIEEIKFNVHAERGADFGAVFGDKRRPENPSILEQYALDLIDFGISKNYKISSCIKEKHISECFYSQN